MFTPKMNDDWRKDVSRVCIIFINSRSPKSRYRYLSTSPQPTVRARTLHRSEVRVIAQVVIQQIGVVIISSILSILTITVMTRDDHPVILRIIVE